jgi:hypothetical protein
MADAHSTVEYRDVPDFPGYRVGSDGSVWSCLEVGRRDSKPLLGGEWHRLVQGRTPNGYRMVTLRKDGRTWTKSVHQLVLTAFVGNAAEGQECRHLNGDKDDNRLENLAWGTRSENASDRFRHGTGLCGEKVHTAVLTPEKVREIRSRASAGESYVSLGRVFGVTDVMISNIARGKNWKHVK